MIKKIKDIFIGSYTDEEIRKQLLYSLLNLVLFFVALTMTIVNILTAEFFLMSATLIYSVLCLLNFVLVHFNGTKKLMYVVFVIETMILLSFFIISGIPEGFSVLWVLLVPSFVMAIFRSRFGSVFCVVLLAVIIFFFWIPLGRAMLLYDYGDTFMLRFPFVYICTYLIALYVENIRMGTWRRLKESEKNYRKLYRHDALTGIYSRHAFFEELVNHFNENTGKDISLVIFDADDFKCINDKYGHNAGDVALKHITQIIISNICEHCIACRWGGEEFLVFMPCEHDPYEMAERIRKKIESDEIKYGDNVIRLTVSVGVATGRDISREQISDFINRADGAMYESKAKGKNRTTFIEF